MRVLYPPIKPYVNHSLRVDAIHTLHVEECGNPGGLPVFFLHGGPGGGISPEHRRFFDPERYRIILFDQRGCGRSTPHAELVDNTTDHLVSDMEQIRQYLGIERMLLFGGSWGSTLALVYAQRHPQRVLGLVLRGIFLCRPEDIGWFYQSGAHRIFPDAWEAFVQPIPPAERDDLVGAYYRRLTGSDEIARMSAAKAWSVWEARCATLREDRGLVRHFSDPYAALALARIECHYFMHNSFLAENEILAHAARLAEMPAVIVHGRYDMVCPLDQAWALHQAWPDARLRIIADAGHAASEPGIVDALVTATDEMAEQLA